ncbi:phospholipid carrier-dependent glycosyltransferase [Alkalinema sp. FACHB-956]|uniref:dolichyl-phosphate-mannose--protein mannosyltransferase n=1 Tax=Alkalinema sp. FACHB-956 TaxID=2692768 RepID=UPI001689FC87|nr:phospholipid carrier-dependent glycosyltransferase [Alkalinema sp. FACHB-956]MBD2327016.1 phospholipid carrier-dependent glycosyltransferase [Alkalinema sp. FACHB-956]
MQGAARSSDLSKATYYWGLLGIFIISLGLRFWGLERLNTFVFDEVYYAKFANNYLTHTPFFNAHPPLSQYLIAIGIWLGEKLPFGDGVTNSLTGSVLKTWSYRWLNALTGSLIPLVIAGLVYQLSDRRRFAFIAGLIAAIDGLFLVESRYALNNVYLVLFGLLGQICFLIAVRIHSSLQKWLWLFLAGLIFGCAASIKWNGLSFLLGIYGIVGAAWLLKGMVHFKNGSLSPSSLSPSSLSPSLTAQEAIPGNLLHPVHNNLPSASPSNAPIAPPTPVNLCQSITQLPPIALILGLVILPIVTYLVLWLPHLQQNPNPGLWEMQQQIWNYHRGKNVIGQVHPYCSNWISWLIMGIPVAYFYRTGISPYEFLQPNAPSTGSETPIYAVHAMGNPFLWWMTTIAILFTIGTVLVRLGKGMAALTHHPSTQSQSILLTNRFWILLYLVMNYAANLLPWMKISRCAFIYHYMGASVFAMIALALWLDLALRYPNSPSSNFAKSCITLSIVGFIWWMPIYLGLPLASSQDYRLRMWFDLWIQGRPVQTTPAPEATTHRLSP